MNAKTTRGYMDYSKVLSSKMNSKPVLAVVGRAMQWAKGRYGKKLFDGLFQGDPWMHPTQAGAYLIGCVFFASIWNKSPEGLAYAPPGLEDKLTLQKIAAHAVFDQGLPLTTSKYTGGIDGRIAWSKSDTATALQAMLNMQGFSCEVDAILGKHTIQRLQ